MPWRLISRLPSGQSAQITAVWDSCDTYSLSGESYGHTRPGTSAWVGRTPPGLVTITVSRPYGAASCGPAVHHRLTLHPATVRDRVPTTPGHARPGVVVGAIGL